MILNGRGGWLLLGEVVRRKKKKMKQKEEEVNDSSVMIYGRIALAILLGHPPRTPTSPSSYKHSSQLLI